jgi:cytochrome c2
MMRPLSILAGVFAAVVLLAGASSVRAEKVFRDEFIAKYVKDTSSEAKDKAFAEACEKAKCNICHAGVSKKKRNPYGEALAKLLDRKTDKEDKTKIQAALDKVAQQKSDPKNDKSPTFGELLKAGKLPGGEPKESTTQVSN